jgi:hypothetical protein
MVKVRFDSASRNQTAPGAISSPTRMRVWNDAIDEKHVLVVDRTMRDERGAEHFSVFMGELGSQPAAPPTRLTDQ